MREVSARIKELETELAAVEADRDAPRRHDSEPARSRGPRRRHRRGCRRPARGRRAARVRVRGPRSSRSRAGPRPDRDREGRRGLRLALRLPARRSRAGRAGADPLRRRAGRGAGLHPGRPAGAGPGGAALRDRLLPGRARDDLRGRKGRALPRRHLRGGAGRPARRRDPRRRRSADPLRGDLDLLPPRGGGGRQGHAGDLPRPSVRQGRDVLVRRAVEGQGRARAPAGHRGADPRRARDPLPGRRHPGRRPRSLPPPASSTARPGSRASSATAS